MSKSPAVLFYTSDFLTGTMLMNNEQIGKYIKTLCYQHQQGHLTKEDIETLIGDDQKVLCKFVKDSNGLYYNERMEEEINNRNKFVESRYQNGYKGGRPIKVNKSKQDEDWEEMLQFFNYKCICCHSIIANGKPTKDHITPRISGGTDNIDNLQPLCRECNSSKCADHETDYRKLYIKSIPDELKQKWFKSKTDRLYNPKPNENHIGNENIIYSNIVYYNNKEVDNIFKEFLEIRKKLKAVNSERAINTLKNKLDKYDDNIKIKMIEQSIVSSWKDIYEVKPEVQKEKKVFL